MDDDTPVNFYSGITSVISDLNYISHGVVSQNSKDIIIQKLQNNNISEYFKCVIGYEEVDINKQKPEPDGLLFCIKQLTNLKPGTIFYIGDLESDIQCVVNANQLLKKEELDINIISVLQNMIRFRIWTYGIANLILLLLKLKIFIISLNYLLLVDKN